MKIALSAGHFPQAPGACFGGRCEHETAAEWMALIAQHLVDEAEVFAVPTGPLARKIAAVNAARCDVALEVHFNGCGNCGAHGAETLYFPGSARGEALALAVHGAMVHAGSMRDRGVHEGWLRRDAPGVVDYPGDVDGDEAMAGWLAQTNCPAVIVEPEFIEQYHRVADDRVAICRAIALALLDHLAEDVRMAA